VFTSKNINKMTFATLSLLLVSPQATIYQYIKLDVGTQPTAF